MKNLFIVAVLIGLFSATPIDSIAQKSLNSIQVIEVPKIPKKVKFIDAIEVLRDFKAVETVEVTPIPSSSKINTLTPKVSEVKNVIETCTPLQFKFSQIMNVEVETMTNTKLLKFMDEWWATRYRYGGTTKKGIDCSSLTGTLLKDVYGVSVPRTAREQYRVSVKLKREELIEGDFVFFNTRGGVSHVGIYLANGYFLHSSVQSGVTISSLNETYYNKKYIGGGRPTTEKEEIIEE